MKNREFSKLILDITKSETLEDLKNCVISANDFVKKYKIKSGTEEFNKLVDVIDLVRIKLKKKIRNESMKNKKYIISESQYEILINKLNEVNSRTQQIIDDMLDQISTHGEESLTPSQLKKLSDFSSGKEIDFDKNKNRDNPPLEFESILDGLPNFKFTFTESIETDQGFEYFGSLNVLDQTYVGSLSVNNENKIVGIFFENEETESDLFEDNEGLEHEITLFFESVVEGLDDTID